MDVEPRWTRVPGPGMFSNSDGPPRRGVAAAAGPRRGTFFAVSPTDGYR